jgi:hypothetical protein
MILQNVNSFSKIFLMKNTTDLVQRPDDGNGVSLFKAG